MRQSPSFCPRLPRMAMRAGRSWCCGHEETTHSLMTGPVRKMVLLPAEKGRGVPVRHWRPERSPGVMAPANANAALPPAASDGVCRLADGSGEHIGCRLARGLERHAPFGDAKGP